AVYDEGRSGHIQGIRAAASSLRTAIRGDGEIEAAALVRRAAQDCIRPYLRERKPGRRSRGGDRVGSCIARSKRRIKRLRIGAPQRCVGNRRKRENLKARDLGPQECHAKQATQRDPNGDPEFPLPPRRRTFAVAGWLPDSSVDSHSPSESSA